MVHALVVQHAEVEGVGRFAEWMPAFGLDLRVLHPYAGDALPAAVDAEARVVMGGPMGANDDAQVPWLAATKALLVDAVERGVPTLGVCLGAQLLAVATGGKVERGAAGPELGLGEVACADGDRVLVSGTHPVVQWHYDIVTELPPTATLLASSASYPVQAFRVGEAAWGLQFHIEATPEIVADWARAEDLGVEELVAPVAAADHAVATVGQRIAKRFVEVVTA
ncbi:MAG: type 1 glutamine amidotransferase [Mycobacteriales bacterium]